MDCPHCHAALPEGAAVCSACGVDLVKLKAREVLAKVKRSSSAARAAPPWTRSVVFLGATAFGACLLLYGAALLAGRSLMRRAPVTQAPQPVVIASPVPSAPSMAEATARPRAVIDPPNTDVAAPPVSPIKLFANPDGTWRAEGLVIPDSSPKR